MKLENCSTKTVITTSIASGVIGVTDLWQMSHLHAKKRSCYAMIATAVNSLQNVFPVTRLSCLVPGNLNTTATPGMKAALFATPVSSP